ncbi:WecB/TagA/CpsF family glycosyltransferase [Novosphingobium sp. SG720]|uniref:WecB/TagA/CpsF family glycosyltransferase n=1 Tax=Novosphingobium sp. SG720 TaxID=2586998 RepID=UPI0014455B25|nr:WecB/TagA/CpsF family glycosyltransferase [Novosphingobium sp. SG720]NKJ43265.1 N-acetylglucosaminyldiphosphoundecaprenol N-acetyl-beta-D-mannosaminyltransferase [Novosphingobium sp. SG720]
MGSNQQGLAGGPAVEAAGTTGKGDLFARYGLEFDSYPLEDVVARALLPATTPQLYCTCNLNHLRQLQGNADFRAAYARAAVVTVDGRPIRMLARLQAKRDVPVVTGADMFPALLDALRPGIDRPFFVASSAQAAQILRDKLVARGFDPADIGHDSPPYGFERDAAYSADLVARIAALDATHLFMGVGAPKSEIWVSRHFAGLPAAHIFCVGAALDFSSSLKARAPAWVRALSLEWAHRMLSEPRRLLPRYAGDALFLAQILAGRKLVPVFPPRP